MTGVEIGPESCVVVRARPLPGWDLELSFAHRLDYPETALPDGRVAAALDDLRRWADLPRQLFAVSWLTEDANEVLTAAGFDVKSVISPPQALALLAPRTTQAGTDAVAWLALNRHRAALSIVSGSRLLFTRTFDWTVARTSLPDSAQGSLLRRLLYVSELAPEMRQAIATVQTRYGIRVGNVVTCGDMPDLRSMTMPLIDELDLEVETLDSSVGLTLAAEQDGCSLLEAAPALRLACAAIDAPQPSPWTLPTPQLIRRAAAVFSFALLASAGWTAGNTTDVAMPTPPPVIRLAAPAPIAPVPLESLIALELTLPAALVGSQSALAASSAIAPDLPTGTPVATTGSIAPRVHDVESMAVYRTKSPSAAADVAPRVHAPSVDLILTGAVRNVALVDGRFVEPGDAIGDLEVVTIDETAVTLRDGQGATIRISSRSESGRGTRGRGTAGSTQP